MFATESDLVEAGIAVDLAAVDLVASTAFPVGVVVGTVAFGTEVVGVVTAGLLELPAVEPSSLVVGLDHWCCCFAFALA